MEKAAAPNFPEPGHLAHSPCLRLGLSASSSEGKVRKRIESRSMQCGSATWIKLTSGFGRNGRVSHPGPQDFTYAPCMQVRLTRVFELESGRKGK